jgi:alpha-L-rhamnosidase
MKAEINEVFFNPENATYGKHPDSGPWGTDVEDAFALDFGIVPDNDIARVHKQLLDNLRKRNHAPITGIVTTVPFLSVLAKFGDADDAYAVMAREEIPGIKSMLKASPDGLCENMYSLSAERRSVDSRCHADMAGWAYWFYHGLGGLRPDWRQPGFKHFVLAPQIPEKMGFARITHESPYGKIVSSWKRDGAHVRWELVVPANSTATAVFPDANAQSIRVETKSLKDAGLSAKAGENGTVTVELVAGAYTFDFDTITK